MIAKRVLTAALCATLLSSLIPAASRGDNTAVLPAGLTFDKYPALREVYKDYFLVGTIDRFDNLREEFINYNFNAVTNENKMKPSQTQKNKGIFTLEPAKAAIDSAKSRISGVNIIGHTLTWHSQSPNWLWDAPDFNRDTALENLYSHIDTVLGEFGGGLHSVDVVNEAIGSVDPNNPEDFKAALDKGEGWVLALGWEWVELAFLRAAKIVDENGWDCKLYINDFGLDSEYKARTVYELVRDINERHAGHRPGGKQLIEGIGMQGHYNSSTKMSNVESSVALFAALPGVYVSFTELDMEYLNAGLLSPEQYVSQARKYAQLFQILKKYAAGPANTTGNPKVIERVTFWGSDDGASWKSAGLPMLFNAPGDKDQITGKEALIGALWPDEYLTEHPVPDEEDNAPALSVPGVYVYSLSRGDTWGGANIILGSDASEWPWSTADGADEIDGAVAFVPEKDETYRLSVNYTAMGTFGIRVRWINNNTNGGYTAMDAQVVNTAPYSNGLSPNETAVMVPAVFNSGMVNAGTYTLVTEIKMDGSLPAEDLTGNLAVRGALGGNAFEINWIRVEKVATGEIMTEWDPLNPPKPAPEPVPEPKPASEPQPEPVPAQITEAPKAEEPPTPAPEDDTDGKRRSAMILSLGLTGVILISASLVRIIRKKK